LRRGDGLRLTDCFITAPVRCVPPDNKPLPEEFRTCRPWLLAELRLLERMKVVVGLGKLGFDAAAAALRELGLVSFTPRPAFGHGARCDLGPITLLGTYHPSQQNTFTGKLTAPMLNEVFALAKRLAAD
ncbi:MAG TPA: uracil-DNA glycosylase family protein, partial [Bacteroidota bacterium]